MRTSSFFKGLWRFNAMLIAAAGLVALLVGSYALLAIGKSTLRERHVVNVARSDSSATGVSDAGSIVVGHFSQIAGTSHVWASMQRRDQHAQRYYSKTASNVIDYVFYDVATGKSHRLRGKDDGLILRAEHIGPSRKIDAEASPDALLVTIVEQDTSGDGLLSMSDERTLALARPNGSELTSIVKGVEKVLGWTRVSARESVVMVQMAKRTFALHVDLTALTLIRKEALLEPAPGGRS